MNNNKNIKELSKVYNKNESTSNEFKFTNLTNILK
jgi:hypothetical protein